VLGAQPQTSAVNYDAMIKIEKAETSVDVICSTADEFLQILSPLGGLFGSGTPIFRGVSSRDHELLPNAHRKLVTLYCSSFESCSGPLQTIQEQCAAEFYTLDKFFSIASRHGVHIPEDSYSLRWRLDQWRTSFDLAHTKPSELADRYWPSPELYSLIALAQHYGIPTRALDWTWSAYTAAYFAATPLARCTAPAGLIAVWCFDDFTRQIDQALEPSFDRPLVVFTVSGADNENLRAQRGLFMIHPQHFNAAAEAFTPRTYDQLLLNSMPVLKDAARIVRVAVAATEAKRVLALLHHAGVARGSLFPGLWGVAREYEEEQMINPGSVVPNTTMVTDLWERICEFADSCES